MKTHTMILTLMVEHGVKDLDLYHKICQIVPDSPVHGAGTIQLPPEGIDTIEETPSSQDPQYTGWSQAVLEQKKPNYLRSICSFSPEDIARLPRHDKRTLATDCIRLMVEEFSMNYLEIADLLNVHNTTVGNWYRKNSPISSKYHTPIIDITLKLCNSQPLSAF